MEWKLCTQSVDPVLDFRQHLDSNLFHSMNRSSTIRTVLSAALLFLMVPYLSGCATIVRGSSQEVEMTSDPPNARVIVNGEDRGETPTTLSLDTGRNYQVEFEKDGYASETLNLNKDFTIGWPIFGNVFSFGIIGIVVDVANGSAYKLSPEQLQAALETRTADVSAPENSDVHLVLFSKKEVGDTVELSEAAKVEFSIDD